MTERNYMSGNYPVWLLRKPPAMKYAFTPTVKFVDFRQCFFYIQSGQ